MSSPHHHPSASATGHLSSTGSSNISNDFEPGARTACAEAGEYLDKHGWVQGRYVDTNGSACALGALSEVDAEIGEWGYAQRLLAAHISGLRSEDDVVVDHGRRMEPLKHASAFDIITAWNDHPARTAEDVILALKEVGHGG